MPKAEAEIINKLGLHARAAINGLAALVHLIRGGGGKNFAGAGAIEHPFAHQTAVHRLVAAATAGDQRDLAHHGGVGAGDVVGFDSHLELGVGSRRAPPSSWLAC